ncbi:MAG TPA: phosphonatase-like hydrolase [Burkholderiales bacterium]|nr:phosphonatase-like hydrolase [Burkholderiales bacterium]
MGNIVTTTMTKPSLVVFDMAGTTVIDDGQVPEAFTAALAEHGITVGPDDIRNVRGAAKRQAILALLPQGAGREGKAARALDSFRAHLARLYQGRVREIPGAARTFEWLRRHGIRTALNTGFDRETAKMLLEALGWSTGTVDAIVCGDDVARGRPAPDMILRCMQLTGVASADSVANVGDTMLDLQAGHNAAVRWNVGVLTGAHERALMAAQPHTHLLASVAELPRIFATGQPGSGT